MVKETMDQLAATNGLTFAIIPNTKNPDGPIAVTVAKEGKETCFIHNISRGVIALCGDNLFTVLGSCIKYWIDNGVNKINLTNSILDGRFRNKLEKTGCGFNADAIEFLTDRAKRLSSGGKPELVLAVDAALSLFTFGVIDDEESVDHVIKKVDNYRNISSMLKGLIGHVYFKVDEGDDRITIWGLLQKDRVCRERRTMIADKLGVTPLCIEMLCQLIGHHGTPLFIVKYAQYLEDDRKRVGTLATAEDVAELVSLIRFS
jgi:hypothetical protein